LGLLIYTSIISLLLINEALAVVAEISTSNAGWEWLGAFPRSARSAHTAMQQRLERFWLSRSGF
jgi:hypothetical protein